MIDHIVYVTQVFKSATLETHKLSIMYISVTNTVRLYTSTAYENVSEVGMYVMIHRLRVHYTI